LFRQQYEDGDGSVFPSFNDDMMTSNPWLAAYTYLAHILFILKVKLSSALVS
jgi:hypothetical protein